MCERPVTLFLMFLLKIIVFILVPLLLFIFKDRINNKYLNIVFRINIVLIVLFIILRLFNNSCIINSNFNYLKNMTNSNKEKNSKISDSNNANKVEKIVTNKIYKTKDNKNVYYFNNNQLPLSEKKIKCKNKNIYMKNYGNTITAVSILVSTAKQRNIDPIEIMNLAVDNNIFNCEEGVSTRELLLLVSEKYNLEVKIIDNYYLQNYVSNGGIVLSEVTNVRGKKNITCDQTSIIVYNVNKENELIILNPNDKRYDYICPEGSRGYGSIIKANTNNSSLSIDELMNINIYNVALERR